MAFEVLLTDEAVRDLEEIHDYIDRQDGPARARRVLDRLEKAVDGLSQNPSRGGVPRELSALGVRDFRQAVINPYRMIYRVSGRRVYIYVVADGRGDMQVLLARRLLEA